MNPNFAARHQRIGWWSLLAFLTLGLVLEGMHGLKVGLYLDVSNEVRRLMWTLAHAHGTLLSILHLVFAGYVAGHPGWTSRGRRLASRLLIAAGILLPAGFFLGGVVIYRGDPGPGIFLTPIGALCLLTAVFVTARSTSLPREPADAQPAPGKPSRKR